MKKHLDYIDKAKGLLIILMVVGHVFQSGYVNSVIYAFHMPAFFAISGFLFNYTKAYQKGTVKFIKSLLFSFIIPFAFFELWGCVTYILRYGANQSIWGFLRNTATLNFNNGILWFLFTLFWVEVVFALAVCCIKKKLPMLILTGLLFIASVFIPDVNNYTIYLARVCRYFLFFSIGFYGDRVLEKFNIAATIIAAAAIFAIAAIFGRMSFGYLSKQTIPLLASSLCGIYLIFQLGKLPYTKVGDRVLAVIGANTLIIYGTHNSYFVTFGHMLGITDFEATPLLKGLAVLAMVAVAEIPTVFVINRFLPFLVGKHKKKTLQSK